MDCTNVCRVCGSALSGQQARKGRPFCSQRCCGQHKADEARAKADAVLAAGEKPCTKCGETKRLSDFYEDRAKLDGRRNSCSACDSAYQKEPDVAARRRASNRTDKAKEAQWRYYHLGNGRKTRPAYAKRPDRIEKTKASARKGALRYYYRVKDTPEYRARVESEAFRQRQRERQIEWEQRPEVKRRLRKGGVAKVARRRALKASLAATLTVEQWQATLAHFTHCCAYCGSDGPLHQDHFIPLTLGGPYTAGNIVPACVRCNASKGNKPPAVWCRPGVYERIASYLAESIT